MLFLLILLIQCSFALTLESIYTFDPETCDFGYLNGTSTRGSVTFKRDVSMTKCSPGIGIETIQAVTQPFSSLSPNLPLWMETGDVQSLLQPSRDFDRGVTFEFWLKPLGIDRPRFSTIFTLGKGEELDKSSTTECDRHSFDVRLSENNKAFEFWFRTHSSSNQDIDCIGVNSITSVQPGKIVHLALTLSDRDQQAYINGQPFLQDEQDQLINRFSLSYWARNSMIGFFSSLESSQEASLWNGLLLQFAVYDRKLSRDEILTTMASGLPGTVPFAMSYNITLREDSEKDPDSHNQTWYQISPLFTSLNQTTTAQDLQHVTLPVYFIEDEIESLLASANITATFERNETSFVYITSTPSRGRLYKFSQGHYREILHLLSSSTITRVQDPAGVVFLPALNEYSEPGMEYTNFTYCVTDHIIRDATQCDPAVVSIYVERSNDPPRAVAWPFYLNVMEGQVESQVGSDIKLGGVDIDQNDFLSTIQITSPPRWGSLVLRVTTFRADGIAHGTALKSSHINYTLASQDGSIRVIYVFDQFSDERLPVAGTDDAVDSFRFRVSDSSNRWSMEETVHIRVDSALTAAPNTARIKTIHGKKPTNTSLTAFDRIGRARQVGFFIEIFPDEKLGLLYDPIQKQVVKEESLIMNGSTGNESFHDTLLSFLPGPDLCNINEEEVNVTFAYRAVALVNHTHTSVSQVANETLEIRCEDDPIKLRRTGDILVLQAFSIDSMNKNDCGVSFYDNLPLTLSKSCSVMVSILGIEVATGRQRQGEPVLVAVDAGKGFLTFSKASWDKVKLIRGRRQMAYGEIAFSAHAEDLEEVFAGLSFRSQTPGEDVIQIFTEQGYCWDSIRQNSTIVDARFSDSSCHRANLTIALLVEEGDVDPVYVPTAMPFPSQILLAWFGLPLLYSLYWRHCIGGCGRKEPSSDDESKTTNIADWYDCNDSGMNHNHEACERMQGSDSVSQDESTGELHSVCSDSDARPRKRYQPHE